MGEDLTVDDTTDLEEDELVIDQLQVTSTTALVILAFTAMIGALFGAPMLMFGLMEEPPGLTAQIYISTAMAVLGSGLIWVIVRSLVVVSASRE